MPNYQDGKIYKIESPQTDKVYIGSTTQKLCDRMTNHRSSLKIFDLHKKKNCTSFDILRTGDAKIYLIELFPCNSKEELEAREGYWQKEMRGKGLLINKVINKQTYEEWCELYKDKRKALNKQYWVDNKDKLKKQNEKYRIENREKCLEKQRESSKNYYEKNKLYRQELIKCDICDKQLTRASLTRHKKLKHV